MHKLLHDCIPQRLKSMFFEKFFAISFGATRFKKIPNLAFEANSAVSLNCTIFLILANCAHGQSSCYITIWPSIGKINSLQHAKMLSKIDNFFNHFWYFWTHFFLEGGVVIVEGYFSNMSENIFFDKIIEFIYNNIEYGKEKFQKWN